VFSKTPSPLIDAFRDTPLQNLYHRAHNSEYYSRYRYWRSTLKPCHFDTPKGTITLDIPAGAWLADQADKGHEPQLTALLLQLGRDDVFFDVGAHVGYTTSVAQQTDIADSDIHAFEVDNYFSHVFHRNCGHDVQLNRGWVGESQGEGMVVLDEYAKTTSPPSVVKIDIEGAELTALKGMEWLIDVHQPAIYVEVHPDRIQNFGSDIGELFDLLWSHGYETLGIGHREEGGEWVEITRENVETVQSNSLVRCIQ
jgi:hypothetical protein